jgi:hypothetical protein
MDSLKIVHGFRPYEKEKKGLFRVLKPEGGYSFPEGWETQVEEITIIGEDRIAYAYRLQQAEQGTWVGNKVITKKFMLPIGVHKSRLIEWITPQLKLF